MTAEDVYDFSLAWLAGAYPEVTRTDFEDGRPLRLPRRGVVVLREDR